MEINSWNASGQTGICYGIKWAILEFEDGGRSGVAKAIVVMSDGMAEGKGCHGFFVQANDSAVKSACEAKSKGITVHSIGFGEDADNITLQAIANCGGGNYTYADATSIVEIYRQVADNIIKTSYGEYSEQTLQASENVKTRLYPDSFIEFNYTKDKTPSGLILTLEERFNDTNSGTFDIPQNSTILETRAISYSGSKWTDKVLINGNKTYDLSSYGSDYIKLGDPYAINIPNSYVQGNNVNNVINITTGISPDNSSAGSIFNKIIYILSREFSVYSEVVPDLEGCIWDIEFEDGEKIVVGDSSLVSRCSYNSTRVYYNDKDSAQVAVYNLLRELDFDLDDKVNYKFLEQDLQIELIGISGIPFINSNELQVRVWR